MPLVTPTGLGSASDEDIYKTGLGIITWNQHLLTAVAATASPTSQTIHAVPVGYRAGQRVTRIGFAVSVAAAGTNPTGVFVGVCSTTTLLMDSANLAAGTMFTTAGVRTGALSSVLTIPADGLYYHLLLVNGTWGTTQPTLGRQNVPGGATGIDGAGVLLYGQIGTGQTTLPAVNAAVVVAGAGGTPFITFST